MKIYNEVIIDMNPESEGFNNILHEDSYNELGPIAEMRSGNWGALGVTKGRRDAATDAWAGLKEVSEAEKGLTGYNAQQGQDQAGNVISDATQLERLTANPQGGAIDAYLSGPMGIKNLPSRFNTALSQGSGSPGTSINMAKTQLEGKGRSAQDAYDRQNLLTGGLIPTKTQGYSGSLVSAPALAQNALDTAETAMNTAKGSELTGLQSLYDFYGASPNSSAYNPTDTLGTDPLGLQGSNPYTPSGPTGISGLEETLRSSNTPLMDDARTSAQDYGTAMQGPAGLFGEGSQQGFGIGAGGELSLPTDEIYSINSETGDINFNEGVNPSQYGGKIFDLLTSIQDADAAQDKSQYQAEQTFDQDVKDSERDMRLAKEGKLDFTNKTRRDIEKIKQEQFRNQLSAEKLRESAGGVYSGPTERTIFGDNDSLKSSLADLMTVHKSGIKSEEDAIKELRKGRERTQIGYEDDISDIVSNRKAIESGTIIPGMAGLQDYANTSYGTLSSAIGDAAASGLTGGIGAYNDDGSLSYGDSAEGLTIDDIFGTQLAGDGSSGMPGFTGNAPDMALDLSGINQSNLGSIGNQLLGNYTAARTGGETLRSDYDDQLAYLLNTLTPASTNAIGGYNTQKIEGPQNLKTDLMEAQLAAGTPVSERAKLVGSLGSMTGGGAGYNTAMAPFDDYTGGDIGNQPTADYISSSGGLLDEATVKLDGEDITIPGFADTSLPSGSIRSREQEMLGPLQMLYQNTFSDVAKEDFNMRNLEEPGFDVSSGSARVANPVISKMESGASKALAAENEYSRPFERNVLRSDYATPDVAETGGTSGSGWLGSHQLSGSTKRGGAVNDYFFRLAENLGKDSDHNVTLPSVNRILDSSVIPEDTGQLNVAINNALGGHGTSTLKDTGIRSTGGFQGSAALQDYGDFTKAQGANLLGMTDAKTGLAPTQNAAGQASADQSQVLINYLVSQGLLQ